MIKFKFEHDSVELPTEWEEVKVRQFIMPEFLSGNALALLASLSGIPKKALSQTTEDLSPKFAKTVQFMQDDPKGWMGSSVVPERILFLGKQCKVPANIEMAMFGQKIMLGQAIQRATFVYGAIPEALAIYFGPQVYPDDWFDRMPELIEAASEMPIVEVYSIVSFFLSLFKKSKAAGQPD